MSRLPFELSIPKPCSQQWLEMAGTSATRHCASCDKAVHNLSALTPRQIERLVFQSGGKLCRRITLQSNGDLVSVSETTRPFRARFLLSATLALAPASGFAQQSGSPQAAEPQVEQRTPNACTLNAAALAGVITDNQGALLVGADVTLRSQGQPFGSTKTDAAGCFQFGVAPGNYEVEVAAKGFTLRSIAVSFGDATPILSEISLRPGAQVTVEVTAVDAASYTTMGELASTYTHWYQRFGYRLRHPVAYAKYKMHQSHS